MVQIRSKDSVGTVALVAFCLCRNHSCQSADIHTSQPNEDNLLSNPQILLYLAKKNLTSSCGATICTDQTRSYLDESYLLLYFVQWFNVRIKSVSDPSTAFHVIKVLILSRHILMRLPACVSTRARSRCACVVTIISGWLFRLFSRVIEIRKNQMARSPKYR